MDLERQSFSDTAENASNAVYELNSSVRRLKQLCSRSTAAQNLSQVVASVATKGEHTSQVIDALNQHTDNISVTERLQQQQITKEFNLIVKDIASLQQKAGSLLRQQVAAATAAAPQTPAAEPDATEGDGPALIQVLEQLDQGTVDLHQQLIEERELEIGEIQRGMNEINAIFSDLGTLIQEQGAQLDTVEDHVTDIAAQTASAQRELVKADNYQRSRGRWSCYCLLALLVITVIVALTFV